MSTERLNESSINDLTDFKNTLEFVNSFDIDVYEAITVIDDLLKMSWEEIEDWRNHLLTNYTKTNLDNFIIKLIDSYCSNIVDD